MKLRRRSARPASNGNSAAPWRWAIVGVACGALLVLLLAAPARWLGALLAHATSGAVQLQQASGSVWNGSARLLLTGGEGSRDRIALPGRVHWRLTPGLGALHATLRAECCTPANPIALRVAPRWGGAHIGVQQSHSVWPASLLTGLGTPFNTLLLHGELQLDTQPLAIELAQGRLRLDGQASITANRISSRLSTLPALGDYRVELSGGATPALRLSTLQGPLLLDGNGQWNGGRLRFSGEAGAAADMEAQLANLLNIIGVRRGDKVMLTIG
ncbi:MAG: type II secretion system protein N [Ottowia sp.]|nr:type II secretion system protein N [Ottowia sp.]